MNNGPNEFKAEVTSKGLDPGRALLSRADVALLMDVSKSTVRRLADAGELGPVFESKGEHFFEAEHVAQLVAKRRKLAPALTPADEVSARAFELLAEPIPLRDITLRLRLAPERVLQLYELWRKMSGRRDLLMTSEHRDALTELLGDFGPGDELVLRVKELRDRVELLENQLSTPARHR